MPKTKVCLNNGVYPQKWSRWDQKKLVEIKNRLEKQGKQAKPKGKVTKPIRITKVKKEPKD